VWWVDLDPVRGHEQGGRRPAVVVSTDRLNRGRVGLIVACPLTRAETPRLLHVRIEPPEANVPYRSFVLIEHVRSLSVDRLGSRIGRARPETLAAIDEQLRRLLGLAEGQVGQLSRPDRGQGAST